MEGVLWRAGGVYVPGDATDSGAAAAAANQATVPVDEYHYVAGTGLDDTLLPAALADEKQLCDDYSGSAVSVSADCTRARYGVL